MTTYLLHPITMWSAGSVAFAVVWFIVGRRVLLAYLMSDKEARPIVEFLMFLLCGGPFGWIMLCRFLRFHFSNPADKKGNPTTKP